MFAYLFWRCLPACILLEVDRLLCIDRLEHLLNLECLARALSKFRPIMIN